MSNSFVKIPYHAIYLTKNNIFKPIDIEIFTLILDRLKLSNIKNYRDKKGVYCIYRMSQLAKQINCTKNTVNTHVQLLKENGFIESVREMGITNVHNKYYIEDFDSYLNDNDYYRLDRDLYINPDYCDLTSNDRLVYALLTKHFQNIKGDRCPNKEHIATTLNITEKTVNASFVKLEEVELIKKGIYGNEISVLETKTY